MKTVEDITQLNVLDLLPQRPPFVLIDKILHYNSQTTEVTTSYKILPGSTFVDGDAFQPAGLMENIAQTCAARIGYHDWLHDIPVKIGVIGAVKGLHISTLPKAGDEIFTTITPVNEVFGVVLAKAYVKDAVQNLICECFIKIAV